MSSIRKISDICDVFDGPHATPKRTEKGPIYLGIKAISPDGSLNESEFTFLSEEDYAIWTKRVTPKENDIVFSYEATLGRYALIPKGFYGCLGRRLAIVRAKSDDVNIKWLYYYFRSPEWTAFINNHRVSGSTVDRISIDNFPSYTVKLPSREHQDIIVNQLEAIDQKIQLNKLINSELEAMAKTIYDYWFTQFNFPNAEGKPYKSAGGEMVWNEELKREIPMGWVVKSIKEIEDNIITGKTPATNNSEFYNGDIPFITIGDIRDNMFVVSTEQTLTKLGADSQPTKFIPEDSICVTCIASPGLVGFSTTVSQTNQQINTVVCKNEYNRLFLYFAIKDHFDFSRGAKTGNVFANMNKGEFESIKLVYPKTEVVNRYHKNTITIIQKIKLLSLEIQELTKLRDWLLPMLINGQAAVEG